jgi:hypothetical protein
MIRDGRSFVLLFAVRQQHFDLGQAQAISPQRMRLPTLLSLVAYWKTTIYAVVRRVKALGSGNRIRIPARREQVQKQLDVCIHEFMVAVRLADFQQVIG